MRALVNRYNWTPRDFWETDFRDIGMLFQTEKHSEDNLAVLLKLKREMNGYKL